MGFEAALYFLIVLFCLAWLFVVGHQTELGGWPGLARCSIFLLVAGLVAADPYASIRSDFIQHAAIAAQNGETIATGMLLPHALHSDEMIGDLSGLYYGRLFYLFAGYLAAVLGGMAALKTIVMLAVTLQISLTYRLWSTISNSAAQSVLMTALTTISTYAFNNLIVRGAVPEFVATSLLFSATAALLLFLHTRSHPIRSGIGFGLICGLFIQTHPITGVFGAISLSVISLTGALRGQGWKPVLIFGASAGLIILAIAASWLLIVALEPMQLQVSYHRVPLLTRLPGVDDALLRLSPLPLTFIDPKHNHPYFFTQINAVLLGVVVIFTPAHRRWPDAAVAAIFLAAAALCFFISVSPLLDAYLPAWVSTLQFSYRLTTYVNLFLFAACAALSGSFSGEPVDTPRAAGFLPWLAAVSIAGAIITTAVGAGLVTWTWGSSGPDPQRIFSFVQPRPARAALAAYGWSWGCYYSPSSVAVSRMCSTKGADIKLRMGQAPGTQPEARQIAAAPARPLTTNVIFHPWNTLTVDGEPCQCRGREAFTEIAQISSALPHKIAYRFEPSRLYLWLDLLSVVSALLALAAVGLARLRPG